jgi:uncharacterized protein
LPVLVGDTVVAALDIKADREARQLRIQRWTPLSDRGHEGDVAITEALGRFERFQFDTA